MKSAIPNGESVYLLDPPMRMWGQDHKGTSLYEDVHEVFFVECKAFGYPRVVIHKTLRHGEDDSFGISGQFTRVMDGVATKEHALSISGYEVLGATQMSHEDEPTK